MDLFLLLVPITVTIFTFLGTIFYKVCEEFRVEENKIIASSSCPSRPSSFQSSFSGNWEHHVFPSFHGADVRKSFLSHILKELRSNGIVTFSDNEIKRGESIGPELKRAIRGSKIAIVLLSKNYASSSWCLDELVKIMKYRKKLGQTVITIFYDVEPTDVKKQAGDFGKAFRKTCAGKTYVLTENWRQALNEVATIAGYHSRNWGDEAAMIEKITTDILNKLNEVRMVPGICKSTISKFLSNQPFNNFQLSAIMVNIIDMVTPHHLHEGSAKLQLQNQRLPQMINHKFMVTPHSLHEGSGPLQLHDQRLSQKLNHKYMVAPHSEHIKLDDEATMIGNIAIDTSNILNFATPSRDFEDLFWMGSGILITTNRRLLEGHGITHIYEVDFSSNDEALQLFCMYAFGQKYPRDGFRELAWEVVFQAGKLPLGLEVLGSYFRNMSKQEWIKALPKLQSLDGEIENILKFSYDSLDYDDKYLFLHIACLFNYEEIERVKEYLAKRFPYVIHGLNVLAEKSLIYMERGWVRTHDLLARMGREIVRKESIKLFVRSL